MTDAPAPAADLSLQADASPDLEAAGPSYYRLDAAAWAVIAEQYRSGATAKTLSKLWRVSPGTIYRHACAGGWTKAKRSVEVSQVMVARERERLAFAKQIAGEAQAAAAPREADPLEAARTLARRGAGSALKGRSEQAKGELALAHDLARCARLLAQVQAEIAHAAADRQDAFEEEERASTPEEDEALNDKIIAGLRRHARRRGRRPPQRLPLFCWLPGDEQYRPLAAALGVIDADDNAVCPDFEAAVEACRLAGRAAELDAALREPVPLEHCVWLNEAQKAEIAAEERGEIARPPRWVEEAQVQEPAPPEPTPALAEAPHTLRLGEAALPWSHLLTGPRRLSTSLRYIGGP